MITEFLITVFKTLVLMLFLIAVSEIIISNSLEFLKKYYQLSIFLKVLRRFIVSFCFVFSVSIATLLGSALLMKIKIVNEITMFGATIFISLLTFLFYFTYMSKKNQAILIYIQEKTANSIVKFILKKVNLLKKIIDKYIALEKIKFPNTNYSIKSKNVNKTTTDLSYLSIINHSRKGEISLIVSYLDSIVLVMTALGLLLTTKITTPFETENSENQLYVYIYILIFIAIIISKIHANHEKEVIDNINLNVESIRKSSAENN